VLHDDGDGIRVRVEGDLEFLVWHLLDGSIRQALVGLEGVHNGRHEFGGDVHVVSTVCYECLPLDSSKAAASAAPLSGEAPGS
jgi:hypothetical protein